MPQIMVRFLQELAAAKLLSKPHCAGLKLSTKAAQAISQQKRRQKANAFWMR